MDHQTFAQLLGNYGEFVGAVAVVATLAYLAVQIRQSSKATVADIYQNRATTRSAANQGIAFNHPEFHKIMYKLESKQRDGWPSAVRALTDEERYYVMQWHAGLLVRFDNLYFQHRQGLLPPSYFDGVKWSSLIFAGNSLTGYVGCRC
jgi:hypothetical protein